MRPVWTERDLGAHWAVTSAPKVAEDERDHSRPRCSSRHGLTVTRATRIEPGTICNHLLAAPLALRYVSPHPLGEWLYGDGRRSEAVGPSRASTEVMSGASRSPISPSGEWTWWCRSLNLILTSVQRWGSAMIYRLRTYVPRRSGDLFAYYDEVLAEPRAREAYILQVIS